VTVDIRSNPASIRTPAATGAPVLDVRDLQTQFFTDAGIVRAVDGVTFQVAAGETLGIVGESGSGKSVTALSLMRLLDEPSRIVGGEVRFQGRDVLAMSADELRALRGDGIAMVFQDPMTALNPMLTVGRQLTEGMEVHLGLRRRAAEKRAAELLADVAEKFLLIVKPNANVDTSDAYEALDERSLTTHNSKTILSTSVAKQVFDRVDFASLTNDFEVVAFDLAPEIRRAKGALLKAGANAALLAGSGSAVFGVFDSEDAQRRAIQAIELETGWRVFPCRTVGRSEYQAAIPY